MNVLLNIPAFKEKIHKVTELTIIFGTVLAYTVLTLISSYVSVSLMIKPAPWHYNFYTEKGWSAHLKAYIVTDKEPSGP